MVFKWLKPIKRGFNGSADSDDHSSRQTTPLSLNTADLNGHTPTSGSSRASLERRLDPVFNQDVYALVIGINDYTGTAFQNLEGAVDDADEMEEFILSKSGLGAKPENVISLRAGAKRKGHQGGATRREILAALRGLDELICKGQKAKREKNTAAGQDNEEEEEEDGPCIVIFYAGHGSSAPVPKGWEDWATDEHDIEMLCPSDMGLIDQDTNQVIEGIPDRMICSYLNGLAERWGNNIVSVPITHLTVCKVLMDTTCDRH